jgi:hypothetical protein
MVYSPSTKLSYDKGYECCTVLTEGNVMVTKCLGSDCRIQMKLVDWLILAERRETVVPPSVDPPPSEEAEYVYSDDEEVTGDTVDDASKEAWPCRSRFCAKAYAVYMKGTAEGKDARVVNEEENVAFNACEICHPKDHDAVALKEMEWISRDFPVGTKLRWMCDLSLGEGSATAIVTKTGVLQVKMVHAGTVPTIPYTDYKKVFYDSALDWYKSLPKNGDVQIIPAMSLLDRKLLLLSGELTDAQLVKEYMKRFRVNQTHYGSLTALENLETFKQDMETAHARLSRRTLETDLEFPKHRMSMTKTFVIYMRRFQNYTLIVNAMNEQQKNFRPKGYVSSKSRSRLWLTVNGRNEYVTVVDDKIAVGNLALVQRFDEIPGVEFVNGKPKLIALYRKKKINLY